MSRWSKLGSNLGGGFSQGMGLQLQQKMQQENEISKLKNQLEAFGGLDQNQKQTYMQMKMMENPLMMIMAQQSGMDLGGMMKPGDAGVSPGTTTVPSYKIGSKVRLPDGKVMTIEDDADLQSAMSSNLTLVK
jgi:hypothetical protein